MLEREAKGRCTNMADAVASGEEKKLGLFARIGLFYRQIIAELRKVVWPTRKQLTTYTAVVLVFVTFIIAVVSLLDLVLTKIVFLVFG
ncbi:MAG: preprotein translocase subunit SecE [Actinomycetota bacterium]